MSTAPQSSALPARSRSKSGPTPKRANPKPAGVAAPAPAANRPKIIRLVGMFEWLSSRALQWIASIVVAMVHLETVQYASATGFALAEVAAYVLPAALLLILRPASRRRFYRFAAPLTLTFLTYPDYKLILYVMVFAWVFRLAWFVERGESDPSLRSLLGRLAPPRRRRTS